MTPRSSKDHTYEPAYKKKEKTELCKNWERGIECKFGDQCAFAHGYDDLQKKTHVASRYKVTLCKSYHSAPYYCQYGSRCQFAHLARDFNNSDNQNRHLLSENARIMMDRINGVADPDINIFNVAKPDKPRLAVFSHFCPLDTP